MDMAKKKGSAEASANLTREKYIKLRKKMQGDTHVRDLFDYLYEHGEITPIECAIQLKDTRIGSTVYELRHTHKIPVVTKIVYDEFGKRHGVYSIDWEVIDDVQMPGLR